ncbi:MAG TPA: ATPase, T2SS/T4P/T4SS family [candidate division Zixibacteria bacterium]|nr:ATPase, T2SS/T4P/T4SS family [candidate division Zixibacteria bacterium]
MGTKKKIGDLLIEKGFITQDQLDEGLREQRLSGERLGEVLVEKGFITEDQLTETISERLGIPKISLNQMVIDPSIVQRVTVDVARRYLLIPIFEIGNTMTLAMADPLNIIAIDEIKYLTGSEVRRAVANPSEIKAAIDEYYSVADSLRHMIGPGKDRASGTAGDSDTAKIEIKSPIDQSETETPVVKLVNLIISKAVKDRATDIHIEPDELKMRVRYRVDGVMREEADPPKSMQNELVSRIKVAADLDVSEKRLPQDGRFMMAVDGRPVDLRISTLPTIHGEKIVIRILDRRNLMLAFKDLGFNPEVEEPWNNVIHKPEGLILITGPTSSGKTSTLYTTLQEINSVEKNIITVEDPVEYSLPLINQIQVNEKAGLDFATTLRAILRQNPDIIMVGEIRDPETARMAIRSALTGHTVFSTMHTNDAPSAISRLIDMGIEPYLVASAVKGVLAQRLVRTNCPECRDPYMPSEAVLRRAQLTGNAHDIRFTKGMGCPNCKNTGLRGLTGVFEFVEVTNRLQEMIISSASINQITHEARHHGYRTLFEAGLDKVNEGSIMLEELLKETSSSEEMQLDFDAAASVGVIHADPV